MARPLAIGRSGAGAWWMVPQARFPACNRSVMKVPYAFEITAIVLGTIPILILLAVFFLT